MLGEYCFDVYVDYFNFVYICNPVMLTFSYRYNMLLILGERENEREKQCSVFRSLFTDTWNLSLSHTSVFHHQTSECSLMHPAQL